MSSVIDNCSNELSKFILLRSVASFGRLCLRFAFIDYTHSPLFRFSFLRKNSNPMQRPFLCRMWELFIRCVETVATGFERKKMKRCRAVPVPYRYLVPVPSLRVLHYSFDHTQGGTVCRFGNRFSLRVQRNET
jgi:hypothetical protein